MSTAAIGLDDLGEITKSLNRVPCIVVHGQNPYGKACVVNELLGKHILPAGNSAQSDASCGSSGSGTSESVGRNWRMVHFRHGINNQISLSLPDSYELVEHLQALEQPWRTVPKMDLELNNETDPAIENAVLEVQIKHPLLKEGMDVIVTPCSNSRSISSIITRLNSEGVLSIVIYAIAEDILTEENIVELSEMRNQHSDLPIFFVRVRNILTNDLTESEQHAQMERQNHNLLNRARDNFRKHYDKHRSTILSDTLLDIFHQLCDLGYLSLVPSESRRRRKNVNKPITVESELVENFDHFSSIVTFVKEILQSCLVNATGVLHKSHEHCLRVFIHAAFDMARDLLVTPKRIDYAKKKENELYNTLLEIANEKQEEIKDLIVETITSTKSDLVQQAVKYQFKAVKVPSDGRISSAKEFRMCTGEIKDLVLGALNDAVATKLIGSVDCLRESVVGTLQRCLESLENLTPDLHDSPNASTALKHILNAAYQVEVTIKTSSSAMHVLWEKMKQIIQTMPGKTPPLINEEWKKWVATDMIDSLSAWRLSRSICSQFRDRLKCAHEAFASSLRHLEAHHSGRLERTEEQRLKVRKVHAPKLARYALESTSLRDKILYGMPQLGREIGRGQYGVVYACDSWGGFSPCAVKSVVPPDDKHWNDLALEFYYTRSVPEHERIVTLHGSIIDDSYAGGSSAAVLLIMERLQRDLYSAIRSGLEWLARLQIAIDAVQGIRFLHSQGLVHRDIKLKNVLLDKRNRAKITDLGFCKPEAMMSGSIVGTPIHMAPELFCGRYDHRVDVYAFGILFWYICAGHVRLPYIYEQCQNKDQLWSDVKRGVRPERLPLFDDSCWSIMEECWSGDPNQRPLLGDVELRLTKIMGHYRTHPAPRFDFRQREVGILSSSPYIDIDF
ncbi:hypothetical protein CHUAL_013361 [Chamberlinius hualienensis]